MDKTDGKTDGKTDADMPTLIAKHSRSRLRCDACMAQKVFSLASVSSLLTGQANKQKSLPFSNDNGRLLGRQHAAILTRERLECYKSAAPGCTALKSLCCTGSVLGLRLWYNLGCRVLGQYLVPAPATSTRIYGIVDFTFKGLGCRVYEQYLVPAPATSRSPSTHS